MAMHLTSSGHAHLSQWCKVEVAGIFINSNNLRLIG